MLSSDANGMRLRVNLPAVQFVEEFEGGKAWTKLVLPNQGSSGTPGKPGVPVSSSTIAIPDGATLKVTSTDVDSYTVDGVELFPVQPEPVDQAPPLTPTPNFFKPPFAEPPFTFDPRAYATDALVPPGPLHGRPPRPRLV